jgi:hypothetical protein
MAAAAAATTALGGCGPARMPAGATPAPATSGPSSAAATARPAGTAAATARPAIGGARRRRAHGSGDATAAAGAAGAAGATGATISIAKLSNLESEADLAAAPGGRVAAAWIAMKDTSGTTSRIAYAFSDDGGKTWTPPAAVDPTGDGTHGFLGYDPALAADAHGAFHLAWLGALPGHHSGDDMGVWTATAAAGSTRFAAPVLLSARGTLDVDKPTITVTRRGSLLVAYDLGDADGNAEVARTTDGVTWTRARLEPARRRERWLFAVCGPREGTDRVWVTYADRDSIGLQWSDDDGVTWSREEAAVARRASDGPVESWQSTTCVGEGRNVWVVYGLSDDGWSGDAFPRSHALLVARSHDAGRSFPERHEVHDPAAGRLFMLPKIAREPGGAIDLVYYADGAGRSGGAEGAGSVRWSRSTDGGVTFGPSVALAEKIVFDARRSKRTWLGDYLGLGFADATLFTAFVDNAGGKGHVAFRRVGTP